MLGLRERMEENGSAPGTGEAKRSAAAPADPEVVDRPLRRRFSPSYKLRIVEEADRCTEPGEVGQVLRREGRPCRRNAAASRSEIRWMRRYASWSGETHGSRMSSGRHT